MTDTPNPTPHALVATRIRQHRVRLGLTQQQAADQSRLPLRTYRRFEASGHGNVATLFAIATAFDRARAIENLFPVWVETRTRTQVALAALDEARTQNQQRVLTREERFREILERERRGRD